VKAAVSIDLATPRRDMTPERLGHLLDRHADALALYARSWCDTPEDVTQEAFVKLAGLRTEPDDPAAWLYRVVRNGAISAGRAARRRHHHEAEAAARTHHPPWFEADRGEAGAIAPESAAEALAGLPEPRREAIVAHLWGGLTFDQIAAVMGVSSSTAHRHYRAGLASLRERLGAPCPNPTTT
jgi:RNA polymerase sigma-70 factor (ECF subfamily)